MLTLQTNHNVIEVEVLVDLHSPACVFPITEYGARVEDAPQYP